MKIFISGFDPFCGELLNSSWEIAKAVSNRSFLGQEINAVKLPVSFKRIKTSIDQIMSDCPDVFILLGQASSSPFIRLERIAVNLMDSSKADNDGFCPNEENLVSEGPAAFFCPVHLKKVKDDLVSANYPVKISNTAGTFVCNAAYYYALYHKDTAVSSTKIIFVHLPLIADEQTFIDGRYYLPQVLMEEAVTKIIELVISE